MHTAGGITLVFLTKEIPYHHIHSTSTHAMELVIIVHTHLYKLAYTSQAKQKVYSGEVDPLCQQMFNPLYQKCLTYQPGSMVIG